MAGVEQLFDFFDAVALFAFGGCNVREHEVIDDRVASVHVRIQIVALEERVVSVARMRDHEACIVIVFSSMRYAMQGFELMTIS